MQKVTASAEPVGSGIDLPPRAFLPLGAQVHSEIQQFVLYESQLLDHNCFDRWAVLLARNLAYRIHIVGEPHGSGFPKERVETHQSLCGLCRNLSARQGVVDAAAARIRRCVMNVGIAFSQVPNVYEVVSYVQVVNVATAHGGSPVLFAERRDRLRHAHATFLIERREVLVDCVEPNAAAWVEIL
jgi:3-phenylpropionate/cinnamic acid dioxygenase small subunit